jgi:hypothetical protein
MKTSIGLALLGLVLAGCAGSQGNPDGQPYANEPGGMMAAKPEFVGSDGYDPYAKPAPFADMQAGQAATMPPPQINVVPYVPPRR